MANEKKIKENNQQNDDLINLKLTKNEAAELLELLVKNNVNESKKWPQKVELKLKRAYKHDGFIPHETDKSLPRAGNKNFFQWLKGKLGLGEENE